ncbi:MAG: hypothetical protein LBR15_10550 [Methanobrevibacter sp.]|jgi:Fe2+ transport system protein B|nr:hypothetical protein [Candidatus Methanovirga australis]
MESTNHSNDEQSEIEKKYERYLDDLYYDEDDENIERSKKIKRNKRHDPSLKDQLLSYERDHGSISSIPIPKSNLKNPDRSLTFEKKDNKNYNNKNNNNKLNKQNTNTMSEYGTNKTHDTYNYTMNNDNEEDKYYIKTESNPFPNLSTINKSLNSDINNNDSHIEAYINDKISKRDINKINPKDNSNNRNNNQLNNTNRKSSNKDHNYIKNEKRKMENKIMNKKAEYTNRIPLHKKSVFNHDNSKPNKTNENNDSQFITTIFIILIIFIILMIVYGFHLITEQSIFDYLKL